MLVLWVHVKYNKDFKTSLISTFLASKMQDCCKVEGFIASYIRQLKWMLREKGGGDLKLPETKTNAVLFVGSNMKCFLPVEVSLQ